MTAHKLPLNEIKNLILITIGATLLAIGVTLFLLPAKIATGGTPGIAIILHYTLNSPVGLAMIFINIPLLLVGIKFIDFKFALRTLYSIIITSVAVDFLPNFIDFPQISSLLLSTLYGGVCAGAGIGLVLKGNASSGGTTIIAKIVSNYVSLKPAQTLLVLDMIIIIAVAVIFQDMELALWSLLSIYITTRIVDKVLMGSVSEKIIHIVADKTHEIGYAISTERKRDGTILSGQNFTVDKDKKVLFAVVGSREIQKIKTIVLEQDPKAIMIIMEASEMMGSSVLTN
jgi:uncharacterized membrane-anchored protein YitT (DUF2179 family)